MTEETKTNEAVKETTATTPKEGAVKTDAKETAKKDARAPRKRQGGFSKRRKRPVRRRQERKPEFDQKIIGIRRVTRVMAGGRRFSFAVAMVIGDRKGRVGVGTGKAGDTALAIQKAVRDAKKNMITVARTDTNSIAHSVEAKYAASVVAIRPAAGRGLVAGASVRTVLELAGVTDVTSKIMTRSKNKINIARATVDALKKLKA